MAFCLPTTYFTSALFPSPVVGSVGFVLGTDSGLDIFFLRSLLSVMTYSNLSELQKGFNERARYTLSAWRQSVLVCKASALQIDIRGSPRGEISYVQEFPRIILAWKPMQTFFSWFCIKPALWKQGGADMFVLSHFGSSPALLLTTHHAGGLCALGSSVPSLSYWAVLHHPAVSYHMVITWMSFQWRR